MQLKQGLENKVEDAVLMFNFAGQLPFLLSHLFCTYRCAGRSFPFPLCWCLGGTCALKHHLCSVKSPCAQAPSTQSCLENSCWGSYTSCQGVNCLEIRLLKNNKDRECCTLLAFLVVLLTRSLLIIAWIWQTGGGLGKKDSSFGSDQDAAAPLLSMWNCRRSCTETPLPQQERAERCLRAPVQRHSAGPGQASVWP